MRPVAIGRRFRVLTLAQRDFFRFGYCKLERLKPDTFMGPITKRLVPRSSAGTPVIGPCFKSQYGRLLGCEDFP